MKIIELENCTIQSMKEKHSMENISFSIETNDVCSVQSDSIIKTKLLLRVLATLEKPVSGTYLYNEAPLDLADEKMSLAVKKKIGYIAPDAAMISNISIRENLLLGRYYSENSLMIDLEESVENWCKALNIHHKIDRRPAQLNPMDLRIAITIRELSKHPDLLIMNQPEDLNAFKRVSYLSKLLEEVRESSDLSIVFFSRNENFFNGVKNKLITIKNKTAGMSQIDL